MFDWVGKAIDKLTSKEYGIELLPIPGEEKTFEWRNQTISYSVMGEGKPLLLIHGANASAWRFEVRRNIEPLAVGGYRVYAPDMPGFGKNTREARPYTAAEYIAFIKDFAQWIKNQDGEAVTVIAGTLMAAHTIGAAYEAPDLFGPMILICPTGIKHLAKNEPSKRQKSAFQKLSGRFGKLLFWTLTSRPSTRSFLGRDAYHDKKYVTTEIVEGYHRAARRPNAQYAPYSFITEYLSHDVEKEWPALQQPVAIVWGKDSKTLPPSDLDDFLRLRPNTAWHIIANSSMGLHDERADEFNQWALETLKNLAVDAQPQIQEQSIVA